MAKQVIRGKFCERKLAPAGAFAAGSFRWTKRGRNWLLIGCPKGKWAAHIERCKVGTRAYAILTPKPRAGACKIGRATLKGGGVYAPRPVRLAPYGPPRPEARFGDAGAGTGGKTACAPVTGRYTTRLCITQTGKPSAPVNNAQAVCKLVRGAAAADREGFYALYLDTRNRVTGIEQVAKGNVNGVEAHPREVFKGAALANAAAVLLVHNHPSGMVDPSEADIEITKRLNSAGALLGVPVRDHVIVGPGGGCASMRSMGLDRAWESAEMFRGTGRG